MSGLRITIVRHGEPNEVGTADPPLTETGHRQAAAACSALVGTDFDLVVSSPALRAQQTGAALLDATGHSAQLEPALTEIDYGDEEYIRIEDARARTHVAHVAGLLRHLTFRAAREPVRDQDTQRNSPSR